ncbi:S-layer family protein [Laspinema sp. A4]|uniref:beta strand repeat-containing protein n=1 Tax=Laspinema sp. D2d TaxID=2953686 RepID=UPI0021BAD636|nr:S-layer family protein [Laspinema sp. D2d]MCT7984214.1 S-layer family protein [Laspinema sp. D2d]
MKKFPKFWSLSALFPALLIQNITLAQILPDATLPVNSQVTIQDATDLIEGGTNSGPHLFHSFSEFSIPTGRTAYFNNAPNIQTIFTRITGNSISEIDGLIRANGTVNLFLLNPNGIVFGPNASLDIGGSFLGTTAGSIKFADGFEFSAIAPQVNPLLTMSVPVGLQMGTNEPPGTIQVQGANLWVKTGQTLGLLGGDLTIAGNGNPLATSLTAGGFPFSLVEGSPVPTTPGGRIELGSVRAGNVAINPSDQGFSLGYDGIENFGDIQVIKGATINTSGTGGGEIQLQGRHLQINSGSRIISFTLNALEGGDITVNTSESVHLSGNRGFVETFSRIASFAAGPNEFLNGFFTLTFGAGNAGNIIINTSQFIAENGAFIITSTAQEGQGGSLTINANDFIKVSHSGLFTANRPGSIGPAGDLTLNTRALILEDLGMALAGTAGIGTGGNLTVNAAESIELIGGQTFILLNVQFNTGLFTSTVSPGDAGDIQLTTQKMILRDGAFIAASVGGGEQGQGQGGAIEINASELIEVSGVPEFFYLPIGAITLPGTTGPAGSLTLNTGILVLNAKVLVSVSSQGSGNAGNLFVNADSIILNDQSALTADTLNSGLNENQEQATINLTAGNLILRQGSRITTNARGENVIGGNINIEAQVLTALENSDISANSQDFRGGQVNISAQGIFGIQFRPLPSDQTSDITATSERGAELSGIVRVNTPELDPTAALVPLETNFLDPSGQISSGCHGNENSFTVVGRGGIPASPTDPLSEVRILTDLGSTQQDNIMPNQSQIPAPAKEYREATQWQLNEQGQVVLVAATPNPSEREVLCTELSGSTSRVEVR